MAASEDDVFSGSNVDSTMLRQNDRELSSPWSRVVRGGPEETPAAGGIVALEEPFDRSPPRSVDLDCSSSVGAPDALIVSPPLPLSDGRNHGAGSNASREKKSPWSAPSNGLTEMEPVMGAVSWPALSEATKNVTKPSSESAKLSGGSVPPQSAPSSASTSQKPAASNASSSPPANYTRQKTKRAGSNGSALTDGRPAPLSPTSESSTREFINRSNNDIDHGSRSGVLSPQMQGGNDHHKNHGGSRRGNNGQHHNFNNRRDQDRGAYEWNQRSFVSGRDSHLQHRQQQRNIVRPFIQPPPLVTPPFIPPPRISTLGSPIGYHEIPSPVFYVATSPHENMRGIPFVPPPAVYFAAPDPHLQMMLAKQIEYYFSPENLCKDSYLRQNMDEEGWVPVSLIATFNRVKVRTNSIQVILDSVRASSIVEVQGDKIRKRTDWMNWPPLPSPATPDSLATRISIMGLEDGMSVHNNQNISPRIVNAGTPRYETSSVDSTDTT